MLWKKGRRSDNVEDVRDQSTGGGGGMRIGGGGRASRCAGLCRAASGQRWCGAHFIAPACGIGSMIAAWEIYPF